MMRMMNDNVIVKRMLFVSFSSMPSENDGNTADLASEEMMIARSMITIMKNDDDMMT